MAPGAEPTEIPFDPGLRADSATPLSATQRKPSSFWTVRNKKVLLDYLLHQKAAAGEGANPTKTTWKAAAAFVNADSLTKGAPKDGDSCQSKYQKLKQLYQLVIDIINNSGWAWTDDGGACIGPANEGVWAAWVKKKPKAAEHFCNAGWAHLEAFRTLKPQSAPRGNHVFRPQVVPPQDVTQPDDEDDYNGQSQPWDLENDNSGSSVPRTPAPAKCKRPAAASAGGTVKKARTSGALALQDIAVQALDFNGIIRDTFGPSSSNADLELPPTPVRLQKAIKRAHKLEMWMGREQLVSLLEVLEASKSAVDVYDSLDDEDLRIRWVKRKVGITV
ncbi:hypothetical protein C8R43DRAFT_1123047 [Mycena crocata]|nr:hypothetical protein C8R43DRAFT_1123047 [Mycena crocata]